MFHVSYLKNVKTKIHKALIFVYINSLSLISKDGHTQLEDVLEEDGKGNVIYPSTNNIINILKRKIMRWTGHVAPTGYLRNI